MWKSTFVVQASVLRSSVPTMTQDFVNDACNNSLLKKEKFVLTYEKE